MIQIIHPHFRYSDAPGNVVRCAYERTLRDLLIWNRPGGPKKLYYQILTIPIHQLEARGNGRDRRRKRTRPSTFVPKDKKVRK